MKLEIILQSESVNNEARDQVARRTRLALSRFATAIQSTRIIITDTNDPKPANMLQCEVKVELLGSCEIIVHGQGKEVMSALDACLPRVARSVDRTLTRQREVGLCRIPGDSINADDQ